MTSLILNVFAILSEYLDEVNILQIIKKSLKCIMYYWDYLNKGEI